MDGEAEQHPVTSGDRGGFIEQGAVRPDGRRLRGEHGVVLEVTMDRAAIVGKARLDPLKAVHRRALSGERGEHAGPGGHSGLLVGR
jgi:hypothetical protein